MELNERLDGIASELTKEVKKWQSATALFEARIAKIQQLNAETVGKVEAGKLRDSLERRILRGKKLFTEEQLAEVAQEIEASADSHQGVRSPLIPDELYEFMARKFADTTSRLENIVVGGATGEKTAVFKGSPTVKFRRYSSVASEPEAPANLHQGVCDPIIPGDFYEAVEIPGAGGGRAIKFRRYKSFAPDFVPPPSHKNIIEAIRTMQHAAWENSKAHGWNEAVDNPASALMMITREVSELAEEERDASSGESTKIPGFSKKEEEAADIAIRLLSYCGARNMRLGAAICAKHEFNKTRPYRHGDKLF